MRLGILAPLPLIAVAALATAGCGTASPSSTTTGQTASAPATAGATGATGATPSPGSSGTGGGPTGTGAGCPAAAKAQVRAGSLGGVEFVSPRQGWAVGQDVILATSDGGAHWTPQRSGSLGLTSVDFVSAADGWAVGATSLLATTDGGAHWSALAEPCPVIRSVHFTSPADGYAVAGGTGVSVSGAIGEVPLSGGVLLATSDGGRTWRPVKAPASIQSACFSDAQHGWLGAGGLLFRTTDGGGTWTSLTASPAGPGVRPGLMTVECAAGGTAWALGIGPDAGMSQEQHVGYRATASGAAAIFAEQYFPHPGAGTAAQAPGPEPGPYSALSASAAVFIDWCDACGLGTAPWDVAAARGSAVSLRKEGNVGQVTSPEAASFLSAQAGWVTGSAEQFKAGKSRSQERIVATADGGRTWATQYAGPWSPWAG